MVSVRRNLLHPAHAEREQDRVLRFWRLANLPCGLTHFDWFSEQTKVPEERDLEAEVVKTLLQRLTFEDWKRHSTQDDVAFFFGGEVDIEIAEWQRDRDEGRDPYEST